MTRPPSSHRNAYGRVARIIGPRDPALAGLAGRIGRAVVLVGMPGTGKTVIGRRTADALGLPFRDADEAIEEAAGLSVSEIFELYGEPEFRRGEREVIARLMQEGPQVLATGGGAWLDAQTRALVDERAVSVWLRAELDVLLQRVMRNGNRPLLRNADPRARLEALAEARTPLYQQARYVIDSSAGPQTATMEALVRVLNQHWPEDSHR